MKYLGTLDYRIVRMILHAMHSASLYQQPFNLISNVHIFTSGYITKYRTKNTMTKTEYDTVCQSNSILTYFSTILGFSQILLKFRQQIISI
jgi:hypothetical protein